MPKKTLLTPKERIAVEVYAKTGNKTEAIRQAYPNIATPDKSTSDVFDRPRVKAAVQAALDKLGITGEEIIARFKKQATTGKNDAAKVRANENLAHIADIYPDKNPSPDNGGVEVHINY